MLEVGCWNLKDDDPRFNFVSMAMADASRIEDQDYCYLTTVGRVTGEPREIEIWFALLGDTLYMLSGGRDRSDWVRNARKTAGVRVRIAGREYPGSARLLDGGPEEARARRAVAGKYRARGYGDLDDWERNSLVVAVDLDGR